MSMKIIREGTTKITIPDHPSPSGVFYNPKMELSRDIDIAFLSEFESESYVDALAATGVRGVRVANEIGLETTINDIRKEAYQFILRNIEINGIKAEAMNKDARILLHERRYDVVDIDPFGSPSAFLDSACSSVKKLLAVTATDTAPLCGAHRSGIRKYAAVPVKTWYHREMGVRILLGKIARDLMRHEKSMHPLISYTEEHFIRTILRIERGVKSADDMIKKLGFIIHCGCGHIEVSEGLSVISEKNCPNCGGKRVSAGPLYTGPIHDREFCERVLMRIENMELGKKKRAAKIIEKCSKELEIPFYYDSHILCARLEITPPPIKKIILALRENGFLASGTHFSGTSFKTDAEIGEVEKILCSIA
ncbi:MAG: tRNA (guanine(10)-N(2))-dimethyltransferase [Candidatus Syntropharchaeia archaeon]